MYNSSSRMPHVFQNRVEHDRVDIDYREEAKHRAQLTNIAVWSLHSGRCTFNPDEQYWTLMDDKSFELETVETAKLISSRQQFHGINDNREKYEACLKNFSGITGHFGDVTAVLRRIDVCPHGGIFYLDTMSEFDEISAVASTMLAATLITCVSEPS